MVVGERGGQIGEAADLRAGWDAASDLALGQPALERAPVAHHQHDHLVRGDLREPLAERIPLAQHIVVVVEEHADDLDLVAALLELRQDHPAELVARRVTRRREDVGDLHFLACS